MMEFPSRDRLRHGDSPAGKPSDKTAGEREIDGEGIGASVQAIIMEAQQSAAKFVDEARHQGELIVKQAREESKRRNSEALGQARERVDSLVKRAEEMLTGVDRLSGEIGQVTNSLKETSRRLSEQVDGLLGDEPREERDQKRGRRF
ncbi:MAG: hypothetical protein M3383_08150 [Actinomycetota bacterium]|nr:hypothetical protein [Actinomycetota bacterium]